MIPWRRNARGVTNGQSVLLTQRSCAAALWHEERTWQGDPMRPIFDWIAEERVSGEARPAPSAAARLVRTGASHGGAGRANRATS